MADTKDRSVVKAAMVNAFLPGPNDDPVVFRALLDQLEANQVTRPTHGGFDERRRFPYDGEELALDASANLMVLLWREERPEYSGHLDASPNTIERLTLDYLGLDSDDVETVHRGLVEVIGKLAPLYASLHFHWNGGNPERAAAGAGARAKLPFFRRCGPPGVFVHTWFGPDVVRLLGTESLTSVGAQKTSGGGMDLELLDEPWNATFEQFRARQLEVDAVLRPLGVFADYTRENAPIKGPKWELTEEPRVASQ